MNLSELTHEADAAAARYSNLTGSWQQLFDRALNASNFGYGDQAPAVVAEAYQIAESFLDGERDLATAIVDGIALQAQQTTVSQIASTDTENLTEAALEHASATQRYLLDETIAQIHRDIALVRQSLQQVALEVTVNARARRIPQRQALIEHRITNADKLPFMFFSRAAQKWPSKKFIRALWRQTLLAVYNEVVMLTLADHGIEVAAIASMSMGHEIQGEIISLTGSQTLFGYGDIRTEYFHPNSNSYLTMERHDVHA